MENKALVQTQVLFLPAATMNITGAFIPGADYWSSLDDSGGKYIGAGCFHELHRRVPCLGAELGHYWSTAVENKVLVETLVFSYRLQSGTS